MSVDERRAIIDLCDVFVLVLPSNIWDETEFGYAVGLGKQTIIVGSADDGAESPHHLLATEFCPGIFEVLGVIDDLEAHSDLRKALT